MAMTDCTAKPTWKVFVETKADACLVVAAPELLRSAEMVIAEMGNRGRPGWYQSEAFQALLEAVQAAMWVERHGGQHG